MLAKTLRGLGETLITLGVVILLFCGYELYFTGLETRAEQAKAKEELFEEWQEPAPTAPSQAPTGPPAVDLGDGLAILRIPRLGRDYAKVVFEGVRLSDLRKGPGHVPGTAMPGVVGNFVVSGHRTTYGAPFGQLDELAPGDAVVVETRDTWFTYRMTRQQIVAPSAVEVTYAVPGDRTAKPTKKLLTLTTCNPKYSARTRLIVTAELQTALPKSAGQPPALTGTV